MKHIDVIKQLQTILSENPQQRVEKAREPRVDNTPPQRVNTATPQRVDTGMTSYGIPTDPRVLRTTPHIHQRHTRRNIPMTTIIKVADLHSETKTEKHVATSSHRWDLPVLHYHEIMVIYFYPFLVVITLLFSWIIFINDCICILTGSPV